MKLHLLSARRLGEKLAADEVSPQEQAFYLAASFVLWILPYYLFVVPPPVGDAWPIPLSLWFYETVTLVVIYIFGVLYCLARCHVEPRWNFLIDFSCLYAPISLTTLVAVWGAFHVYASLAPWILKRVTFETLPGFLVFIYSLRVFDLIRFAAVVGVAFIIFVRIGNCMQHISRLRLSANHTVDADAQPAARGSP
jgi:hypothetical protein